MATRPANFQSGVSLKAAIAGQTYNLNDRSGIFLELYDLGMATIQRLSQRAPGQDGDTDLGGLIEPRYVDLAWRINGRDLEHYRDLRETIMTIFRRRDDQPVQLVFDFGDGRLRALDVNLDGALDWRNREYTTELVSGVFKASDPRLYDPTVRTVSFNLLPDSGGLPIPFTIPIPIGADTLNVTSSITYAGSSRLAAVEYPIITLHGPIDDPIIENLTTAEQIALTANGGLSLAAGEFVVIDLSGLPRRDSKTMRNQDGNSVAQYLSTDSDFDSWHLAYAGELVTGGVGADNVTTYANGTNLLRVQGSNVTINSYVTIIYYDRYEGV